MGFKKTYRLIIRCALSTQLVIFMGFKKTYHQVIRYALWLSHLILWMLRPWRILLAVLFVVVVPLTICVVAGSGVISESLVRMSGVAYQIFGFWVALRGLVDISRILKRDNWEGVQAWRARFPKPPWVRRNMTYGATPATVLLSALTPGVFVGDRLTVLETRFKELEAAYANHVRENERSHASIRSESNAISDELRALITKSHTEGFWSQVLAISCFVVGVVLSALSAEIVDLFAIRMP